MLARRKIANLHFLFLFRPPPGIGAVLNALKYNSMHRYTP
jgi:hypothetical protein